MSVKPNFAIMTTQQLRAYVLEHRDEEDALQAYLDRRRSENPNSRVYGADDDISEAVTEYLKNKKQEAS
jgi:hypothetical protein